MGRQVGRVRESCKRSFSGFMPQKAIAAKGMGDGMHRGRKCVRDQPLAASERH